MVTTKPIVPMLVASLLLMAGCGKSTDSIAEDSAAVDLTVAKGVRPSAKTRGESSNDPLPQAVSEVASSETASPEAELATLTSEYAEAHASFLVAYRNAESQEDRTKAMEAMPRSEDFAKKFLALAKANRNSSAAVDALLWVTQHSQGEMLDRAHARLLQHHSSDARVLPIIMMMAYSREASTEAQLRGLRQSSEPSVRGVATYVLGSYLIKKDEQSPEAMELLQSVVDDYADVSFDMRGTQFKIAMEAEQTLFALNNLQIGKMAPEIEGADLDGVDFKLSDYRGKVVLLDFWGNW